VRKKPTIKTRVRVYLAERDMTQGDLAQKLGMSEGQLSNVLNGKGLPTVPQLAKLEALIGLKARDFAEVA
jgi:transcriptional regulator with XRE-family HTH domain